MKIAIPSVLPGGLEAQVGHHAGREGVEGAAELEGAHALQVLALEEHLGAEFGVHRARGHYRRAVGVAGEALAGGFDVGVGGQRERREGHGGVPDE